MLKPALRSWIRQPALAVVAVCTLALGIGASVAIFSAVDAVLLKPLPYAAPHEVCTVRTFYPDGRFTNGMMASEEMAQLDKVAGVAATAMAMRQDAAFILADRSRQVVGYQVSERFFPLFGVTASQGRWIGPEDDVQGAPTVVVLSHALWLSAYGGRPDVVGLPIQLGPIHGRIVGVAPPTFDVPAGADLWANGYFQRAIGHSYSRIRAAAARCDAAVADGPADEHHGRYWARDSPIKASAVPTGYGECSTTRLVISGRS